MSIIKSQMKTLKLISVFSFLLISGIQIHSINNIVLIFLYAFTFFENITNNFFIIKDSWECILFIPLIGTLVILGLAKPFKERYLTLFCIISLLSFSIYSSGLLDKSNYKRIDYEFLIPFSIFLMSSLTLILKNFSKSLK